MKAAVVVVCAGKGRRLGGLNKARIKLKGKPLFYHAANKFTKIGAIKQVVLVLQKDDFGIAKNTFKNKKVTFVEGGRERNDSVYNGLCALSKDIDYVLIHDGARPFVTEALIKRILKELKKHPAVICGMRAKDTVKEVDDKNIIKSTLNRKNIFLIQTPQGFKKDLIVKAYRKNKKKKLFDDAQSVESIGKKVKVIDGEALNFKITYREDYILAKRLVR